CREPTPTRCPATCRRSLLTSPSMARTRRMATASQLMAAANIKVSMFLPARPPSKTSRFRTPPPSVRTEALAWTDSRPTKTHFRAAAAAAAARVLAADSWSEVKPRSRCRTSHSNRIQPQAATAAKAGLLVGHHRRQRVPAAAAAAPAGRAAASRAVPAGNPAAPHPYHRRKAPAAAASTAVPVAVAASLLEAVEAVLAYHRRRQRV